MPVAAPRRTHPPFAWPALLATVVLLILLRVGALPVVVSPSRVC